MGGSLLERGYIQWSFVRYADSCLYAWYDSWCATLSGNFYPLGFESQIAAAQGYKEILQKFPEFQDENLQAGIRWLAIGPMAPYSINMVSKKLGSVILKAGKLWSYDIVN